MKLISWYTCRNLKPQGPFTIEDLKVSISRGEVRPGDLISSDEVGDWRPAREWREFPLSLFPANQNVEDPEVFFQGGNSWVVLVPSGNRNGLVQDGPYSVTELRRLISEKKISMQQMAWKDGLSGWCYLDDRQEFQGAI